MPERVVMPNLGLTMEQGTITEWLKREGDTVAKDEPLFVVETDKAALEVPAPFSGVLQTIVVDTGVAVPVGQTIAFIGAPGESAVPPPAAEERIAASAAAVPSTPAASAPSAAPTRARGASPRARRLARELGVRMDSVAGTGPGGRIVERDVRAAASAAPASTPERVVASPLARKLAREHDLDLATIRGTGPGGRIVAEDVHAALVGLQRTPSAPTSPDGVTPTASVIQPLGRLRRITAERMASSARSVARVTITTTVDMAEAVRFQNQLSPELERRYGARLTYDAMIAKACSLALADHPTLNARWHSDDPPSIELLTEIHVGVAVAIEEGLVVVVLRDAETRSLYELSAALLDLAGRARDGRLGPDDVAGSTFTVTNLGAYGVEAFTPIVNPPEAAILGVGAISLRPAVVGDRVIPREQMTLSLAFDHRVTDGAPAAAFLRRVREILESPYILLT